MKPEHCGFGRSLESLAPGDRAAVEDFKAWLEGRTALTADGKTYVPFSDPRAAIRVCGCRWGRRSGGADIGRSIRPTLVFTSRCAEHVVMCRATEAWELEIQDGGA